MVSKSCKLLSKVLFSNAICCVVRITDTQLNVQETNSKERIFISSKTNNADVSLTLKEAPYFLSPWVESDTAEFQQRTSSKLRIHLALPPSYPSIHNTSSSPRRFRLRQTDPRTFPISSRKSKIKKAASAASQLNLVMVALEVKGPKKFGLTTLVRGSAPPHSIQMHSVGLKFTLPAALAALRSVVIAALAMLFHAQICFLAYSYMPTDVANESSLHVAINRPLKSALWICLNFFCKYSLFIII